MPDDILIFVFGILCLQIKFNNDAYPQISQGYSVLCLISIKLGLYMTFFI